MENNSPALRCASYARALCAFPRIEGREQQLEGERMKRRCSWRVGVMHALLPSRTLTAYIKPLETRNGNQTNWRPDPRLLPKHCTNSITSWDLHFSASVKLQRNCGHTVNCAHGLQGEKSRYGLSAPTEHNHADNQRIEVILALFLTFGTVETIHINCTQFCRNN